MAEKTVAAILKTPLYVEPAGTSATAENSVIPELQAVIDGLERQRSEVVRPFLLLLNLNSQNHVDSWPKLKPGNPSAYTVRDSQPGL